MKVKLENFINYWDAAALTTLGSEFYMMDLLGAQEISAEDGSSILDFVSFDDGLEINVPESVTQEVAYFKAPWDE